MSPLFARFLSADPVVQQPTNLQSYNRYSYVLNNPLNATDESTSQILQIAFASAFTDSSQFTYGSGDGFSFSGESMQSAESDAFESYMAEGRNSTNQNPNAKMQVSDEQIALTKLNEGFKPNLYDDDGAIGGNTTIGHGTLVHKGLIDGRDSEKQFKDGVTKAEAGKLMMKDMRIAESDVRALVTVKLQQHQFDVLTDLAYQVGRGQLSRTNLIKHINNGDFNKAANELNFRKSNGIIIDGLQYRSNRRYNTFRNRDYNYWQKAKRYEVTITDIKG